MVAALRWEVGSTLCRSPAHHRGNIDTNNHSQSVRTFWEEARVHRQLMGRICMFQTKRTLFPRGFQPWTFLMFHTNISHYLMYSEPTDLWTKHTWQENHEVYFDTLDSQFFSLTPLDDATALSGVFETVLERFSSTCRKILLIEGRPLPQPSDSLYHVMKQEYAGGDAH